MFGDVYIDKQQISTAAPAPIIHIDSNYLYKLVMCAAAALAVVRAAACATAEPSATGRARFPHQGGRDQAACFALQSSKHAPEHS